MVTAVKANVMFAPLSEGVVGRGVDERLEDRSGGTLGDRGCCDTA